MASSPRTGRNSVAIAALAIGAFIIVGVIAAVAIGVNLPETGERLVESFYPPIAVTEQGAQIRDLYTIVFLIAAVIFFAVEGLIVWTVLRYRRRPGDDTLPPQTHGNAIAEVVWTVVPTIIVAFLFVVSWQTLNAVDTPSANPETRIRAVAGQFQWQFDYFAPDGETVAYTEFIPTYDPTGDVGGMHVPAGRTVQLSLTSTDVIHAFYVPQFLFKRDVVPGRTNMFEFKVLPEDAGQTFRGQCAELCGAGHRVMLFDVRALEPAAFDAWLQARIDAATASPPPPPSGEPAPSGSGAPSGAPPPSGGTAGPPIGIAAASLIFSPTAISTPADTPFQIDFDNQDANIPHNVAIHQGSPTGAEVFRGAVFPGPAKRTYDVGPLPAGTYAFTCTVHPDMTGTLTVD